MKQNYFYPLNSTKFTIMEDNVGTLDIRAINEKIERESAFIDLLTMEMNKVIVGQKHMIERLLIGEFGAKKLQKVK